MKDIEFGAVFAGYGEKGRAVHKECWDKNIPKEKWVDSKDQ